MKLDFLSNKCRVISLINRNLIYSISVILIILNSNYLEINASMTNSYEHLSMTSNIYKNQKSSSKLTELLHSIFDTDLYHKTDQILDGIRNLNTLDGVCQGKLKEKSLFQSSTIKTFKNKNNYNLESYKVLTSFSLTNNNSNKKKLKAFIIAGEHARELIGVEVLFNFIKYLCSGDEVSK